MQFAKIFAFSSAVAIAVALAAPSGTDSTPIAESQLARRNGSDHCNGGLLGSLDGLLEQILPQLKPLLDGIDATEDQVGKAIPLVGALLDLLKGLCIT